MNVASDYDAWHSSFKSLQGCPQVSKDTKLWYAPDEMDSKPDFSDYQQIGGWKIPYMKMYNFKTVCGKELIANYYV